jgi:hypothetical protein
LEIITGVSTIGTAKKGDTIKSIGTVTLPSPIGNLSVVSEATMTLLSGGLLSKAGITMTVSDDTGRGDIKIRYNGQPVDIDVPRSKMDFIIYGYENYLTKSPNFNQSV